MLLRIVTPAGELAAVDCDSVHLNIPDDAEGKNGGSMGIRRGHSPALAAIAEGEIKAFSDGVLQAAVQVSDGFASVKDDVIMVIASTASIQT